MTSFVNFWENRGLPVLKSVKWPELLLFGERDERVTRKEIDDIFDNMQGSKQLKTFPLAGHENYLKNYRNEWVKYVDGFLTGVTN